MGVQGRALKLYPAHKWMKKGQNKSKPEIFSLYSEVV